MRKRFSVVIPAYNAAETIERCLDSVNEQTYKNYEIIVVNDGSIDDTDGTVKKYISSHPQLDLNYIVQENGGAAKARNSGIQAANGEYICFLDSDDYWFLDKIEKQVNFMEENNYTFIYGAYSYLKNGNIKKAKIPKSLNYKQSLKNHAIFTSTVMLNIENLKKEDIYMPNIRRGQDTVTWWQILKKGYTAYGITDVLSIYRVGEKSLSSNKFKSIKRTWALFKREDLNFIKRLYCFLCYGFNAAKRRLV